MAKLAHDAVSLILFSEEDKDGQLSLVASCCKQGKQGIFSFGIHLVIEDVLGIGVVVAGVAENPVKVLGIPRACFLASGHTLYDVEAGGRRARL